MVEIISKNIDVGSCALHYLEAGNTQGRDVVLLHGMKFQAATWQELGTLDRLADSGFHAIAVDMPGFGGSGACSREQDSVLAGFIGKAGINEPIIIGPSMGGRIALEFGINHPRMTGGLVLVGAVGVEENKDRLSRVKAPTFIVWGGEDQVSPIANSDTLFAAIAGSRKLIIDGAPHPCYLDQPDTWHNALLEFLVSLSD